MSATNADRYGTVLAPANLGLVHRLLNSTSSPRKPDLFDEVGSAQAWLDEALADRASRGEEVPSLHLRKVDLDSLRTLRTEVHDAITAHGGDDPDDGPALRSAVEVTLGADGTVRADPRGQGAVPWLRSAVLLACLEAELTGEWSRLKICANPDCSIAFFDRSKNRSGAWHDVHVCGNQVNLRASRARRRQAAG